ncbi:sugar efflux transporter [Plantactinospora sp. KLBMP9567]|uniref:sugar efflux transporter n=1 Tax=Plantactinospora sp. KLBMP9567 TaxID=3085900 RepID=UPI00298128DE|nr:sugar efflux transporter [Plantactinospora sp. KLBMP9567]MDW5328352.1 sugar efflux transporter [Plantactinospora sp. KLBMP9567]
MSMSTVVRRRGFTCTLLPLGVAALAVGVSSAVTVPFLALFLGTEVQADPARVSLFLIVSPLAGVLVSTLVGWLSDRRPMRKTLVIVTAAAGGAGMCLTAFVRDYWILLALAATLSALAGALFPQLFAYAREALTRDDPGRAAMGTSTLRTIFALAWVAGPPFGALLLDAGGFPYVYGAAAVLFGLAAVVVASAGPEDLRAPAAAMSADSVGSAVSGRVAARWTLVLTTAAFTMLQCPLTLGLQALSLFIDAELDGDASDAGFILGLCAALEIPLMLGLGLLTTRVPVRTLVLAGAACGVGYYAVVTVASSVWVLALAQCLNAAFIAAVASVGISYMQEMLPRHPGQATTLFANSYTLGAVLSGPLLGISQQFGYRFAYASGMVLCLLGLLFLLWARPSGEPPAGEAQPPRLSG